jgi:hypothetical protein
MTIASNHGQLVAVHILPWIFLAAVNSLMTKNSREKKTLAFIAGFTFALIFFTSFYIAWFFTFTLLASLSIVFVFYFARALKTFVKYKLQLAYFLGGFSLGLAPFIYVYLPLIRANVERNFSEVGFYLLTPNDLLNIGSGNWIWGKILNVSSRSDFIHQNKEFMMSPTPFLIFCALTSTLILFRRNRFPFLFLVSILISYALVFEIGDLTPWKIVYDYIPGSPAIRAIGRLGIVTNFWIIIAITLSLFLIRMEFQWRHLQRVSILLLSIALLEQVNSGLMLQLDRNDERAWPLASAKDLNCDVFFIMADSSRAGYVANIDAMILALDSGIPTVNGYSGLTPKDWNLKDTNSPNYYPEVSKWIKINALENVCAVTDGGKKWIPYTPVTSNK